MREQRTPELSVFTLRIDRAKLDALREVADRDYRSVSQEIRRLVDERLARAASTHDDAA